MKATKLLASYQ